MSQDKPTGNKPNAEKLKSGKPEGLVRTSETAKVEINESDLRKVTGGVSAQKLDGLKHK